MVLNDINGSQCKVYSLTWSEFGTSLTSAVRNLRNLEDLTDVTVSAGGKIFPAHKLILGAASPLLMELLKNAKCQHPILMLAGISSSDLETILDFVYQGEVNIDCEKLPSLLQAAQLLDIQALSPNALVMNSPVSTCNNEDNSLAYSNATPNDCSIPSSEINSREPASPCVSLKRKRASRSVETLKVPPTNLCKKSCPTGDAENRLVTQPPPKSVSPSKMDDVNGQEDEKKIISDLPVNCKLCGVTIRQSRNLRRHIDHMHLKQKLRSKCREAKDKQGEGKSVLNTFKAAFTKKMDDLNNNPSTSTVLTFSEDSFTQLTEEIFSCTAVLSSAEGSFSSANVQMTSSTRTPATESPARPADGDSSVPASSTRSSSVEQSKSSANEQCSSAKVYECNRLEDSCNMNDITLKELETQLFSVCFCSAEGEDGQQ